jgi:hypothetical protein
MIGEHSASRAERQKIINTQGVSNIALNVNLASLKQLINLDRYFTSME